MTRDDHYAALTAAGLRFGRDGDLDVAIDEAPADATGRYCDLRHVGVLAMRGRDAAKFLQGYLTCDANALAPGRWLHGALCNLQGRMVGNFLVSGDAETVLMRMPADVVPLVRQTLAKYAVFAKAKLADETDAWVGLGLLGTDAGAMLAALQLTAADEAGARTPIGSDGRDGEVLARGQGRFEVWLPPAAAHAAWQVLHASWPADGVSGWNAADIAAGLPWVRAATSGEYLPQLFNLDRTDGVNFRKGCYLGQEIVTRLQHRGEAKRRACRFEVPAGSVAGGRLQDASGRNVGELVLVGRAPGGVTEALAVVDRGALDGTLQAELGPVARRNLPYSFAD